MNPKTKKLVVLFAALALVLGFAAAELQKTVRVVVSTGTAKGMPDVAYDAQAERYLVVWQERSRSGDDRDIRARVVNRDGTPASDIVALASSGEDERLPKTAATGSSSWTVVWSTGTSIEACTVDATGKAEDFRTVTAASRPADRPDISLSTSDSAMLVVWEELGEMGLTVIKGRRIHAASAGTDGEEFLLAGSSDHDLRNPSVNQSGDSSFVAWEKPVEARRVDVEGRLIPAAASSPLELGDIIEIAADGTQNTLPSVTAFSGTDAFLVVWQRSDGRRDSDIFFAGVTGLGIQTSGKLTDTADFRETRPFASSVGIAGRALVTYQIAPSNKPRLREIAARTIGWGDTAASAEIALDPTRAGGGNPASVVASGAEGRGLVAWDVADGEGTDLYSRQWLAAELTDDGLPPDIDGPIVPLADVTVSGMVTLNGIAQADVLLSGFPVETRTDATGAYSAYVPAPWSGTVIPVQPGFTFSPASNTYTDVNADVTGKNYTATFVGGAEDPFEDNEDFATAAELPLGTTHDLILNDEEWFKILVPSEDAGKDLKIRIWGTGFPDTTNRRDLDFAILDASGKLLSYNTSGQHDETAYICDVVAGYYYVTQSYFEAPGIVYSLTAELSDAFGLGYVTGQVTDDDGTPIEGVSVELLGVTVDWWTVNNPLVYTDADGNYKIGWYPGQYTIRLNDWDFGGDGLDWTPDANYLGEMYNWGEVVTLESGVTLPDIDGALTPGGVIAGRITDGSGNPFPYVYNRTAIAYAHVGDTSRLGYGYADATGEYVIDRLRTGNYAVRLRTTDGPLINEWHDDQAQFASADLVGVEADIPTLGVDAMLEERTWGTIEGRVTDSNGDPVGNLQVAVYDPAGISIWTVRTNGEGYYHHSRVPAGAWKVFFNAASIDTANLVSQYYPGTRFIGDAATVQVVTGETTDGIDATLAAAGSITGQVLNNAGGVNLIAFDTASNFSASVSVNTILPTYGPPTYTINNLAPGTYKVLARPNLQGERMLHWYPDAASYAVAGTVTVAAGTVTGGIDITLATGGALLTGRVLDTGGYPIAGVAVIAQDASKQMGYASALSNEEGYYTIRQVPVPTGTSGTVKVYFNTEANWLGYVSEYYNNKTDYSLANTVTVNEGATTTVPDVALEYLSAVVPATSSLPDGEIAVAYSQQLAATGGRPFYRWEIISGSLPDGLTMGSSGLITGTPTTTGLYPFIVEVTDSTLPATSDIAFLSITVGSYTGEGYTISGTVTDGGSPLPGVVIDGLPGDPVTSASGTYVAVVEPGFWDIVTPVLAGFAFDPPFREYTVVTGNLSGQNYSASAGYRLSGTISVGGAPLSGVRITGLPTEIRTDEQGTYSVMLPIGWGGTVIPVLSGFTFSPAYMNYEQLLEDVPAQDYIATYAGGGEDLYENNDTFETAAVVPMGAVIPDLVLNDEDWFKFEVPPGDAGKVLGIRLFATSFPNGAAYADPGRNKDLDYGVMDATGRLLTYSMSGAVDEVTFIPDIQPGWYYIGHTYMINPGAVYSLFVTVSDVLPVATISGRITDGVDGIDGVTVELFKLPFDWNDSRPMVITNADGTYKIAAFPGDFQVQVNLRDFNQIPSDGLPDGWLPTQNYLPATYDNYGTVTLAAGTPITGADVSLAVAGSISGRITDGEGNPLYQAQAGAYSAGGGQASLAYTDADGYYTINRLRPANYAVAFRPPTGNSLGREWFDGRASFADSLPVAVTAGATTAGIDAVLEEGATFSGRVTNGNGDPIQGVQVTAYDVSGIAMQSASTQSDGTYSVNRIPGGSIKVLFNARNCYSGNYLSEWYADKGSLGEADAITVGVGQTTPGIDAVLAAAGSLEGLLMGHDSGGLLNGYVQAFEASSGANGGVQPDYYGHYVIRNLPPGNYRIRFSYTFNWITNVPAEWYNNAPSQSGAALVPVTAGDTSGSYDGVLEPGGGGISGRVTNLSGAGIAGLQVVVSEAGWGGTTSLGITDADGYYTVTNVPVGDAKVYFNADANNSPYASEYYNDKGDQGSADVIPVYENGTTPNINAVLGTRPVLSIDTTSLPNGELGVAYDQQIAASGGRQWYHGTLVAGDLPPGLTANSRGQISGTPTMTGTFAFTVQATDSTWPQQTDSQELSITIGEYTGVGYTISGTVTSGGTPLPGVVMNGLPGSPLTNAAGGYVAVVPSGWNGTVVPIRSGYAFTPATIAYANVSADSAGQDYTAVAGYTISGVVTLDGGGQAGVVMAGLPGAPLTDASGAYSASVAAGSTLTVTPTLPGFTFNPPSVTYTEIAANQTGQNYISTYAGGVDDSFEDNDSFETAAVLPLGTTSGLVLRDEDWFRVYVPAEDAGKDLRVHIWGTSYPDQTTRRDLDFYVLNSAGTALSLNSSGSPDETAFICDVAEGLYYIGHTYLGLEGTVYSMSLDLNEDFGLGYVEGTVRDDGGTPIPGVSVELYGEPFDWNISRPLVYTDAAGHYRIGYAPGPYTVRFNLATPERDYLEWTPDANFLGEIYHNGEVLEVAPGATLSGIDGQLTECGTITGTVTDASGNPLPLAAAWAYGGDGVSAASNLTDANGHYSLNRLRTGNYAVRFRDGNPYATEWYNDAVSFAAAMPVAVVAGATTGGIDAALGTRGIIAGRVTNDSGDPIIGVQVTAYDPAGIALNASTTDSNGYYGVGRLPTGSFKVLFNAATATTGNFVSEYYADQRYLSDGTDVEVTAGETTAGVDAVLALAGTISGRVTVAGGAGLSSVGVHAFDVDSDLAFSATTDELGNYMIINVPAANYKVRFRPLAGTWAVEWSDDKSNFTEAAVIAVSAGGTATGIDAELSDASVTVTGRVTNGSGAGVAGIEVIAQDTGRLSAYSAGMTDGEGYYSIPRLPTCQTKILFNADRAYLNYANEYYNDKAEYGTADAVTLTVGETPPNIDAVLAARPALTVTTEFFPAGELAVGYGWELTASGGRTLYHWSLESGTLPDGLTLNGRGEISGMPTMAGTFTFTVRVSDSTFPQQVTTKELAITIGSYTGLGHSISGKVLFGGAPLAGVTIGGLPGTPVTNVAGGYVAVVTDGWTGTATPVLAGYVFNPVSYPYSNLTASLTGQDFVASLGYTISGIVSLNASPLEGVLMEGLPGSPLTDTMGYYAAAVTPGWSDTVTPTLEGYTFTPETRTYTSVAANFLNQDYAATAVVPRTAKVDFNNDGQEDLIWRYYGTGGIEGWNVVWLMEQTEALSPEVLVANRADAAKMVDLSGAPQATSYKSPLDTGKALSSGLPKTLKNPMGIRKAATSKPKKTMRNPMVSTRGRSSKGKGRIPARDLEVLATPQAAVKTTAAGTGAMELAALGSSETVFLPTVQDTLWELAGTGDFDGSGSTDVLWRYYGSGDQQGLNVIWYMNGTTIDHYGFLPTVQDTNWRVEGTGDFNGDGTLEILWRYYGTGGFQGWDIIWYMNGTEIGSYGFPSAVTDRNWKVAAIGDFNGDTKADLLWRYDGAGDFQGLNVIWYMDGEGILGYGYPPQVTALNWKVDGAGYFDADTKADLLWRYYGTDGLQGWTVIWYMNDAVINAQETLTTVYDINWRIVNR